MPAIISIGETHVPSRVAAIPRPPAAYHAARTAIVRCSSRVLIWFGRDIESVERSNAQVHQRAMTQYGEVADRS